MLYPLLPRDFSAAAATAAAAAAAADDDDADDGGANRSRDSSDPAVGTRRHLTSGLGTPVT